MSSELVGHLVIDTDETGLATEAACGARGSLFWSWAAAHTTCKLCKKTKRFTTASIVEDASDNSPWPYSWVRYLVSIGRCKYYAQY